MKKLGLLTTLLIGGLLLTGCNKTVVENPEIVEDDCSVDGSCLVEVDESEIDNNDYIEYQSKSYDTNSNFINDLKLLNVYSWVLFKDYDKKQNEKVLAWDINAKRLQDNWYIHWDRPRILEQYENWNWYRYVFKTPGAWPSLNPDFSPIWYPWMQVIFDADSNVNLDETDSHNDSYVRLSWIEWEISLSKIVLFNKYEVDCRPIELMREYTYQSWPWEEIEKDCVSNEPYSYINYADEPITIHEYHFPMCSQEEEWKDNCRLEIWYLNDFEPLPFSLWVWFEKAIRIEDWEKNQNTNCKEIKWKFIFASDYTHNYMIESDGTYCTIWYYENVDSLIELSLIKQ